MPTLPLIDPNSPTTYNGLEVSFGIAPILNMLATTAAQRTKSTWTAFCINIETLIRDRQNKNNVGQIQVIARDVLTDIQVLSLYISTYNQIAQTRELTNKNPVIVFYCNDYRSIPQPYLKDKFPKGTEERWAVLDYVSNLLVKDAPASVHEGTRIIYALNGTTSLLTKIGELWKKKLWPHKVMVKEIESSIPYFWQSSVLLISHVPLDFHLFRYFTHVQLIESFTGRMKDYKQLGMKVFNSEVLPFNKYTHLLLGDKWYMQSLLTLKQKNMLKTVATRDKWLLLPDKTILEQLLKMRLVQPNVLIDPEL